ncbi:MAG: hypothetical protein ACK5X2_05730 [Gemmatimonadaceae bacterium]|jgi:hypothetical protein
MTNDELDHLDALAAAAKEGIGRWLGEEEATVIRAVPALVAEVRRLKEADESAYQRGFNAGAAQLSRALKEVGKL